MKIIDKSLREQLRARRRNLIKKISKGGTPEVQIKREQKLKKLNERRV